MTGPRIGPEIREGCKMEIAGLQKLTLLDYPGKVACTVFLAGCNFRCPYCHNAELIDHILPPEMDSAELLDFLKKRRGLLDGVCLTGGEPTLRGQELKALIEEIRALSFAVKLDTNGTRPDLLQELVREKLVDYVAMDIKNSPDRYAETAGVPAPGLEAVKQSVNFLLQGEVDYEFRTTVVRELFDDNSFLGIGPWIRGAKRYFLQPFEDRDTVPVSGLHAPAQEDLERWRKIMLPFCPATEIRGR